MNKLKKSKLLLIEDDYDFADALVTLLSSEGFYVSVKSTLADGYKELADNDFDLVLLDLSLPDGGGCDAISSIKAKGCPIIVLTGQNDARLAVQALRSGAADYLTKPVDLKELVGSIRAGLERSRLLYEVRELRQGGANTLPVGTSPLWRGTLDLIYAAANAPKTTVLFTGESGTGKEVAALLLHQTSRRNEGPYIAVNASCFLPALLESELFGHEAGAFTGATRQKKGLLELASGGTLFLDEIGELALDLQAKLLRVLEGHPYRRLGGEQELQPNARIVCATNRSLEAEVKAGRFRADLFHRLRIFEVALPPLREREQDIEKLALHFVAKLGAEMGLCQACISPEALAYLSAYLWPGNVRELRNVIERALVLSRDQEIEPRHLPSEIKAPTRRHPVSLAATLSESPSDSLELVIRKHVIDTYQRSSQNVTRAASRLKISRLSLRKRLQTYGLK